jgi:hypothetical protein
VIRLNEALAEKVLSEDLDEESSVVHMLLRGEDGRSRDRVDGG